MWSDAYFEEITPAAVWRHGYMRQRQKQDAIRRFFLWPMTATRPLHRRISHCELAPDLP